MSFARPTFTPFRTVRAKLIFWSVTVLALSLLLFGGLLRYQVQHDILQNIDDDLAHFSHQIENRWTMAHYGPPEQSEGPGDIRMGPPPNGFPPDWSRRRERPDDVPDGMDGRPPDQRGRGRGPRFRPDNMNDGAPGGPPDHPEPRFLSLGGGIIENPFDPVQPASARKTTGQSKRKQPVAVEVSSSAAWDTAMFEAARDDNQKGFSTVYTDRGALRVYTLPLRDNRGLVKAVLQTSRSLSQVNWAISRVNRTLWLFAPLCIAIAAAGGAFLTTRILRPIRQLSQAADTITARELSGRLPVTGQDEFAHLSETFNQMLARLESSFEQQRRFTSDASHELRTPLAAIKAHTSLALQGERSAEELRQTLVTVDGAADRASRTVQDLLLLARSDTGRLGVHLQPTYLPDVVLRAIDTVEAATGYSEDVAPVEMRLVGLPPTIPGDANHLTRLFTNLVENAIRHTPPTGQVQVLMETKNDQVVISVIDTGVGIAPEHLPHMGERFYRVDSSRTRASGGNGLGLAICRSIVEAHGGHFTISSTLGRGTTVQVTLPLLPPATPSSEVL